MKCPECGVDLAEAVDWIELHKKEPVSSDDVLYFQFECPECGKPLEEVFDYRGLYDPEGKEYIWKP